jgi:hypothetical protein
MPTKLKDILLDLREGLQAVMDSVKKGDMTESERRLLICGQLLDQAIRKIG